MSVSQQGLLANDTSLTQDWPPGPCENAQDLKDFGFSGRTAPCVANQFPNGPTPIRLIQPRDKEKHVVSA